jgi:LuxR family maltose regulon positive regulatory protein
MMVTLLSTKFYFPPARANLVSRPRLLERLNEGLRGPLTLVAAPAGYGKTTLMSEWRSGQGSTMLVAWLSLDEGDNAPSRFWFYLISALGTLQSNLGGDALRMLQTPKLPPIENLLTELINNLNTFPKDFVLALDDVHLITAPEIYRGINFLLEHLPPHLHLVILTRADPPLSLSRLRARGQLTEIRAEDLQFNPEETARFLNQIMDLALTSEQVAALEKRTEGWIAGLQLAALSLQGRRDVDNYISAFTGSHHYIVDYLAEEVLSRQPNYLREFLLKTSILERLTGTLCDALTGRTDGQATLELLAQSNLFVFPLDDEWRWYRYHDLFSDVLQNKLRSNFPNDFVQLHQQAAEWHENNRLTRVALDHALSAKDFALAEQLFYKYWMEWITLYNLPANLQSLQQIPRKIIRAAPRLSLINGWMLWAVGKVAETESQISITQRMSDELLQTGDFHQESSEYQSLTADTNVLRSLVATHKRAYPQAIQLAESAIQAISNEELISLAAAYFALSFACQEMGEIDRLLQVSTETLSIARSSGNSSVCANAFRYLASTYKIQGRLQDAFDTYQQALEYAREHEQASEPPYNLIYNSIAELFYEWNDLTSAEQYLNQGMKMIEVAGFFVNLQWASPLSAKIKRARGDWLGAVDEMRQVVSMARRGNITLFASQSEAYLARLQCETGHLPDSIAWINSLELARTDRLGYERSIDAIQCAYILTRLERYDEANELLEWIETASRTSNNIQSLLNAFLLQALVWHHRGDIPRAVSRLKNALTLAEPEGYMRTFLDYDEPMRVLLKTATSSIKDITLLSYSRKLLAAFGDKPGQPQPKEQAIITPLSERELEVLHLIAAGKSNQEIANELVIALGTVKRHIFNIYNKLDVKNRTECVARARALDMLE